MQLTPQGPQPAKPLLQPQPQLVRVRLGQVPQQQAQRPLLPRWARSPLLVLQVCFLIPWVYSGRRFLKGRF